MLLERGLIIYLKAENILLETIRSISTEPHQHKGNRKDRSGNQFMLAKMKLSESMNLKHARFKDERTMSCRCESCGTIINSGVMAYDRA